MRAIAFTDQRQRMRRLLSNALDGCVVDAIKEEEGGKLVILAHRPEGQAVGVRFLGVQKWQASAGPEPQSAIVIKSVSGGTGGGCLLGLLIPWSHGPMPLGTRVRIEAGAARLTIECEDAEWWQDEAAAPDQGGQT